MSTMFTSARVLRRVRRLLPAGLATVALLPPPSDCWEASPLSRLRLGTSLGRGVLGLQLDAAAARHVLAGGAAWLHEVAQRATPGPCAGSTACAGSADPGFINWQPMGCEQELLWGQSADGHRALLLEARRARGWLFWQDAF
ncbi:MAG TPA: hypothetical protein VGC74_02825 [Stenotrophomonas sp.]|jgi:hypothetical protein